MELRACSDAARLWERVTRLLVLLETEDIVDGVGGVEKVVIRIKASQKLRKMDMVRTKEAYQKLYLEDGIKCNELARSYK